MYKRAVPVLHVRVMANAEKFYCEGLGFLKLFAYRPGESPDPCYMGIHRDGVEIHLSSFPGDGICGQCVYVEVEDVDRLHDDLRARGLLIDLEPTDQTWGNREMYLHDLDGNSIRMIQAGKV